MRMASGRGARGFGTNHFPVLESIDTVGTTNLTLLVMTLQGPRCRIIIEKKTLQGSTVWGGDEGIERDS